MRMPGYSLLTTTALAVVVLVTPGCALVKSQQFGVSRSGSDVLVWFVDCYAPPITVTLEPSDVDPINGHPLWGIAQPNSAKRAPFPNGTRVGDLPPGYTLTQALDSPLSPTATYRLGFGSGEAYYESLDFKPSALTGDVLTFDGQVMTSERFTQQSCR
jgi:hypothetical protein